MSDMTQPSPGAEGVRPDRLAAILPYWPLAVIAGCIVLGAYLLVNLWPSAPAKNPKKGKNKNKSKIVESEPVPAETNNAHSLPAPKKKFEPPKKKKPTKATKKKNMITLDFAAVAAESQMASDEENQVEPEVEERATSSGQQDFRSGNVMVVDKLAEGFEEGWTTVSKSSKKGDSENRPLSKTEAAKQCADLLDLLDDSDDDNPMMKLSTPALKANHGRILLDELRSTALKVWL